MKLKHTIIAALCAAPLALIAADVADNTANNARDKSEETLTPIDQSNDAADLKITADTRKMLMKDESLSVDAKNCKIITTEGGAVTLRGPVDTVKEKEAIAAHAKMAGATKITNQLEVKEAN